MKIVLFIQPGSSRLYRSAHVQRMRNTHAEMNRLVQDAVSGGLPGSRHQNK